MPEPTADTIHALLAAHAGAAPAIGAPERPWLSHGALQALAVRTVAALNDMGIGRGDRVAIVLPNGPEAATSFLAIACGATTAPLNPAYTRDEFSFYLQDLKARALVVLDGAETLAREAAASLGVPVLALVPGTAAGEFSLRAETKLSGPSARPGFAEADDVALVLHTSGTTSRPKIVPLRHVNVTASAGNIGRALRLTADDLCLNIMPLFHIHGLIAAVLASVAAGGATCCTPGFNAFRFFGGSPPCGRPGSPPSRRCSRRCCRMPSATARRSRTGGCGCCARPRRRCRRRSWGRWRRRSACR